VTGGRRTFRREGESVRRAALIAAALDCIAEGGPTAASTRAIATRAGVTPGLIRHYFATKEELIASAFHDLMTRMTENSSARLSEAPENPIVRLRVFVEGALTPPVIDSRTLALWACFMQMVPRYKEMREVHQQTYLAFRDSLQILIADALNAVDRNVDLITLRRHAIACNAVIDGLWLEGCALPEAFVQGELSRVGIASVGAILKIELSEKEPSQ